MGASPARWGGPQPAEADIFKYTCPLRAQRRPSPRPIWIRILSRRSGHVRSSSSSPEGAATHGEGRAPTTGSRPKAAQPRHRPHHDENHHQAGGSAGGATRRQGLLHVPSRKPGDECRHHGCTPASGHYAVLTAIRHTYSMMQRSRKKRLRPTSRTHQHPCMFLS